MRISNEFKEMIDIDLKNLKDALADVSNTVTLEYAKIELYKEVTAKYHAYVPKFGDGLYNYYSDSEFYGDVKGDSLRYNIQQIYNKLIAFKAAGYPILNYISDSQGKTVEVTNNIKNNNSNENNNFVCISFDGVRQQVENMSSLTEDKIKEIVDKINEIEKIVESPGRKSKKWEKAKPIIKWIADKGADVGIALLPLLLKIK